MLLKQHLTYRKHSVMLSIINPPINYMGKEWERSLGHLTKPNARKSSKTNEWVWGRCPKNKVTHKKGFPLAKNRISQTNKQTMGITE